MTSSLSFLSFYINWVWLVNDGLIASILKTMLNVIAAYFVQL